MDRLSSSLIQREKGHNKVTLSYGVHTKAIEVQRRKSLHLNGRGGIRTHGTLLTYTHFPGVRLKPLGHPSLMLFASTTATLVPSFPRLDQKKSAYSCRRFDAI
jgi:hypothetical protein